MQSQQSPSLHQAIPAESLLTLGNPSGVPLMPGNPSGVPPYTRQSQRSPSLHQAIPAESPLHQV
ncbi:hypothetical protein AB205_0214190, partial [Aquarana catesbeiana]